MQCVHTPCWRIGCLLVGWFCSVCRHLADAPAASHARVEPCTHVPQHNPGPGMVVAAAAGVPGGGSRSSEGSAYRAECSPPSPASLSMLLSSSRAMGGDSPSGGGSGFVLGPSKMRRGGCEAACCCCWSWELLGCVAVGCGRVAAAAVGLREPECVAPRMPARGASARERRCWRCQHSNAHALCTRQTANTHRPAAAGPRHHRCHSRPAGPPGRPCSRELLFCCCAGLAACCRGRRASAGVGMLED